MTHRHQHLFDAANREGQAAAQSGRQRKDNPYSAGGYVTGCEAAWFIGFDYEVGEHPRRSKAYGQFNDR